MFPATRRDFLKLAGAAAGSTLLAPVTLAAREAADHHMAFGLVTYLWGRDWDLPTLIANCTKARVLGVELRTQHAHGVEPSLGEKERQEVRARFADSQVKLVGLGTNEKFDSPDPAQLKKSIETAKSWVVLGHDVGAGGVKVKPDSFQKDVPREKTIEQIGRSLNELAAFAEGYGQQIRLEVHGSCAELPTIKAIMEIASHENAGVCWNCNDQDLKGDGLEANFRMVRGRFAETVHVRELNDASYPYQQLIDLLLKSEYAGWILLEARTNPADRVAALAEQRQLFDELVRKSG